MTDRAASAGNGQNRPSIRLSAPPRQRRRGWFVGAVALLALAVLVNVYLFRSASHRVPVVVVARDVPIGQQISRADLDTTLVSAATGVQSVPGRQMRQVVGDRAAVDLRRGSLLIPSQITSDVTPHPGQALVAVALKPSQLPPRGVVPGAPVNVVGTPGAQGQESASSGAATLPQDVAATVDQVSGPDTDGLMSISLLVAQGDAAAVARQASTGHVALIVMARIR